MPADPVQTNSAMTFSSSARAKLRSREKEILNYYDDMGPGRGKCTWGSGILTHRGPCTADELKSPVTAATVATEFSSRVTAAERTVRKTVIHQALSQDQYDALVSYTFNMGDRGAARTLKLIDEGKLQQAAAKISSMIRVRVKTKHGSKLVIARGLIIRRAQESAPFRK